MAPIPARTPYTAPTLDREYNANAIRTALANLARSVPPQITRNVTAATTVTTADGTIVADTTLSNFAVTLLAPEQAQYLAVTIVNIGSGTLTITGTVSGAANPTLAQWKSKVIQSDGVRWFTVAEVA